ncbi:hypothetical protein [Larkinella rosea]|uniref:Uncharacterized protein n=1 Tax=Larkinella rosea TaxID=2025312 RepID=A0A3P1BZ75_9BACT|nr:hypothetical protein [Larkinella rosea]RRB06435.1 hypothetical protein EHT25_01115 [Larkinella rosea]
MAKKLLYKQLKEKVGISVDTTVFPLEVQVTLKYISRKAEKAKFHLHDQFYDFGAKLSWLVNKIYRIWG